MTYLLAAALLRGYAAVEERNADKAIRNPHVGKQKQHRHRKRTVTSRFRASSLGSELSLRARRKTMETYSKPLRYAHAGEFLKLWVRVRQLHYEDSNFPTEVELEIPCSPLNDDPGLTTVVMDSATEAVVVHSEEPWPGGVAGAFRAAAERRLAEVERNAEIAWYGEAAETT
jgi:hypothetical protein